MGVYSFYLLIDYWAKIGISKRGGRACCEGDSIGLSAHGSMFVYRNPNTDQRAEISKEYGVDWSSFPPPPEKGGLSFLEEHVAAYCDDAKQNQFHTKSVVEATVTAFVAARPWLGKDRLSHGQSDGASNYRDPTVEVDCGVFGTRCFSVAGMGKDEGDSNGADNKAKIRSKRDAGDGVECADDLVAISNANKVPANTYARLNVDRSNNNEVEGRQSFPRHFHLFTIDSAEFTCYEYLDPVASAASIAATGRAVGYGPGHRQALATFNEKQRSQSSTGTGATLSITGGLAAPKARPSRGEARDATKEKEEKKREKDEAREKKKADARAVVESQHHKDIDICPRCGVRFLTAGGFARHYANGCRNYTTNDVRERKRQARDVAVRLLALDELRIFEEKQRVQQLATVTVTFVAPKNSAAEIGIELEKLEQEGAGGSSQGAFAVASVSGLALESARVAVGFVVARIDDGSAGISVDSLSKTLLAGEKLEVTFRRPRPAIPARGSARETIHRQPRFVLHKEQEDYLVKHILEPMKRGQQPPRAICVFESMKAAFGDKMRMDTRTPLWLEKELIGKWMAETKREMKKAKQRPKPQEATVEPKAKKAKKAPPGKRKAANKSEGGNEEEEEEGGGMDESSSDDDDMDGDDDA